MLWCKDFRLSAFQLVLSRTSLSQNVRATTVPRSRGSLKPGRTSLAQSKPRREMIRVRAIGLDGNRVKPTPSSIATIRIWREAQLPIAIRRGSSAR